MGRQQVDPADRTIMKVQVVALGQARVVQTVSTSVALVAVVEMEALDSQ
jgi:hypothetical protein